MKYAWKREEAHTFSAFAWVKRDKPLTSSVRQAMVFEGWFLILCSRAQPTVVAGFWRLVLFQIKEMHLSEQVDSPHHAELPNSWVYARIGISGFPCVEQVSKRSSSSWLYIKSASVTFAGPSEWCFHMVLNWRYATRREPQLTFSVQEMESLRTSRSRSRLPLSFQCLKGWRSSHWQLWYWWSIDRFQSRHNQRLSTNQSAERKSEAHSPS